MKEKKITKKSEKENIEMIVSWNILFLLIRSFSLFLQDCRLPKVYSFFLSFGHKTKTFIFSSETRIFIVIL